jgi:hypothetical protein
MSTITCPYCNATIPQAGVACPRCGELVPMKTAEPRGRGVQGLPNRAQDSERFGHPSETAAPFRHSWANWQIGLAVLGFMVFMAAVGLGYALKTVEFRRSHDKPEEERSPASIVHPADLPGIGYLPDDVQVIAGVRVAAARASEPVQATLSALGIAMDDAGRVVGVPADDVDHIIVAASLKALPPRLTVVLRARRPINAESVRTALQAGRGIEHNGKTLYQVKLRPKGPDGLLWFADELTIVGGLVKDHFDALPPARNPSIDRFPEPLRPVLRDRVDGRSLAWAAVHVDPDDPTQKLLLDVLPRPGGGDDPGARNAVGGERPAWEGLQDLAASLWAEGADVRLLVQVHGRGRLANEHIGDAVERSLSAIGVVLNERAADGGWLRLSAKEHAKALAKWLDRAKSGKVP